MVDYTEVRKAIAELLKDNSHDDGSWGPVFIRLAWHASGTYSIFDGLGGSDGATMRFAPEKDWDTNKGLGKARERLEAIKKQFPALSYGDLWTLAGVVAVEKMGGPYVPWKSGRKDAAQGQSEAAMPVIPDGRLPDAARREDHVRAIFYRMGFNDRDIVALVGGGHTIGRCHRENSGYSGPWTSAPTRFSNLYFKLLLDRTWTVKKWDGPEQFEDQESKKLMMLPADMALRDDEHFNKWVKVYAKDKDAFFRDFSAAFARLLELGVKFPGRSGGGCPFASGRARL
eukprot:gb/GEZN01010552.1/.p1 GENE.gb/GEZN01010552.1/~~gb/GEZN01010552.1/.p1  ORF type:complete len:285 (+),score=54.82 gb/GEZN01010552.1/:34-888(+)